MNNGVSFEKVLNDEAQKNSRRLNAEPTDIEPFALALSGGGVRAAAVARGLIKRLEKLKIVGQMTHVSSVSGGGYASGELLQSEWGNFSADSAKAPKYSMGLAISTLILDVLGRLVKTVLPVTIILLIFPYFRNVPDQTKVAASEVLAAAIILALVVAATIEKKGPWARFMGRLSFSMLTMISTVVIFRVYGFASMVAAMIFLIILRIYTSYMPHRAEVLDQFKHWPKAVMHGFAVALFLYFYPCWQRAWAYVEKLITPQGGASMSEYVLMFVMLSVAVTAAGFFALRRNKTLFNYYRNTLSDAYLKAPERELSKCAGNWPYPIFNVTANDGVREFQMELTPQYVGPIDMAYFSTEGFHPPLLLADAITASASALDIVRHGWGLNAVLSFMAEGTGYWMKLLADKGPQRLWNFARKVTNMPSPHVLRLADGGFTDNLGLTALLRRKIKRIVCLDAAYDPEYNFNDLRKICNDAAINNLADISIKDLHIVANDLRFAQHTCRVIKLEVNYPDDTNGTIWLAKLAAPKHALRKTFRYFPHITTNDQQLTPPELTALYEIGEELGGEIAAAIQ